MKLEYLFVGDQYKKEIEQYTYKDVKAEIHVIEDSDCWIVSFSREGENETSAKTLSAVNEHIISTFQPTVLSNESSAYYNNKLYSYFNEFERKLRKLLYLKSALSARTKESETIKDLESKDLGKIFELLFTDVEFVKTVRTSVNDKSWQFTKAEIIHALTEISENTVWDALIGNSIVPSLRTDFSKVKDYRNDVMHAHNISSKDYADALKIITTVNEQLLEEINKFINDNKQPSEAGDDKSFDEALGDLIKAEDRNKEQSLQKQLKELQEAFSALDKKDMYELQKSIIAARNFIAHKNELSEITKTSAEIAENFKQIQNSISLWKQYREIISPEIIELQKQQNKLTENIK